MEPITAAEKQLLLGFSSVWNRYEFHTDAGRPPDWVPTAKDAHSWGDDRVVRGDFLRYLIIGRGLSAVLVGARIDGDLDVRDRIVEVSFERCIFAGAARFDGATFTRSTGFNGATFTGDAGFNRATFARDVGFSEATFTRGANFIGATFAGDAEFNVSTFTGDAEFSGVTFIRDAEFYSATFTDDAAFSRATFTRDAAFSRATFTRDARFDGATFTRDARFDGATFTGDATFNDATFTNDATFNSVRCEVLALVSVMWNGAVDSKGLCAAEVLLNGSVFREAIRLDITAARVSAGRLRVEKRIHLLIAGARVDLTDADLAADSLIEAVPVLANPNKTGRQWVEPLAREWLDTEERQSIQIAYNKLNQTLTKALPVGAAASITSLQRARVAGTTISGMSLRDCSFSNVHGLDELRIADVQVLRSSKDEDPGWALPAWFRTRRRLIVDELDVRDVATTVSPATEFPQSVPSEIRPPTDPVPTARAAAGAYRAMRKALEDSKDEPGAADFYYGEMEMRRRAADRVSAERALLTLYWFISGYGLRAWRALTCLGIVIAVAGWCFTNSDWVRPSTTSSAIPLVDPDSVAWPWLFAGGETISLFRPTGATGVTLIGFGTLVDLAIRVVGPVLLALALLAIRNRTKR